MNDLTDYFKIIENIDRVRNLKSIPGSGAGRSIVRWKPVLCCCTQWCCINTRTAKLVLPSLIYFFCSHGESVLFVTSCISQMVICSDQTPSMSFASPIQTWTRPPRDCPGQGADPLILSKEDGKELSAKSTSRTRRGVLMLMELLCKCPATCLTDCRMPAFLLC